MPDQLGRYDIGWSVERGDVEEAVRAIQNIATTTERDPRWLGAIGERA